MGANCSNRLGPLSVERAYKGFKVNPKAKSGKSSADHSLKANRSICSPGIICARTLKGCAHKYALWVIFAPVNGAKITS
jgi:hypothetical protein